MTQQAFPTQTYEYDGQGKVLQYQTDGMTLRDYFAAQAINALILHPQGFASDRVAREAYLIANAMMKARDA